jgi:hypothetical protein
MSKKDIKLLIITLIVIVSGIFVGTLVFNQKKLEENVQKEKFVEKIDLLIDYGENVSKTFKLEFKQDNTVFDLLQKTGLDLKYTEYETGVFIEEISGLKNGKNNRYWLYYINNEMAQIACDKLKVQKGDKINFIFAESPF